MGALHFIGVDKAATERIKSQASVLQRSEISNPPSYGARIVRLPVTVDPRYSWSLLDGSYNE